jgi:GT2 family glycosyltransferase
LNRGEVGFQRISTKVINSKGQRKKTMPKIAIGIPVAANPDLLKGTLAALASNTTLPVDIRILTDSAAEGVREAIESMATSAQLHPETLHGRGACLNFLIRECPSDFYVLLENGALPGPLWLENLLDVFRHVPRCGLAGPSTNVAANAQGISSTGTGDATILERVARQRFGSTFQSLGRKSYLAEFCLAVRHELVHAIGAVEESAKWLVDFSRRAEHASFVALWACGAYVHRSAPEISTEVAAQPRLPAPLPLLEEKQNPHFNAQLPGNPGQQCVGPESIPPCERPGLRRAEVPDVHGAAESDCPLVSCIMPTFNRRVFLPRAIRCFLSQDYNNTELIIVDDGSDPISDLLPPDARIRYFRLGEKRNVGAKRNFACEQSQGEFILHWDDDEWYGPSRVRRQLELLRESKARICGTSVALFYNELADRAFRYSFSGPVASWMGALAYPKAVWRERPFDSIPIAEDVRFISRIPAHLRQDLKDPSLYVASIHDSNTSPKITTGSYWKSEPVETIRIIPGFERVSRSASMSTWQEGA